MGISIVICTKNEEKNLKRCLDAVLSIADEIIIVDSNSTDRTAEIAQSYALVKWISSDWMGFSKTKNYANTFASQDYILSLDADEELSPECQNEIKKIKSSLSGIYSISRLSNYCGKWIKHSGWVPDRHLRLFPAKKVSWEGDVHETLKFPSDLQIKQLQGPVFHYSITTIDAHWSRINSYSTLAAKKYVQFSNFKLFILMLFSPKLRFIRHFVLKLGFLDGFEGFLIATFSAAGVFLKYAKAYQLKKTKV